MASFVTNNWKGHLGISVSELCFRNALSLLINNRSNYCLKNRGEQIIARKFGVNHRAKGIIIRKTVRMNTIVVTKMRGNFVEI